MTTEEKAKILLQYGDYTSFIKTKLKEQNITFTNILTMISDTFEDIIDPSEIKEELLEKEDNDVSEDVLEECMFDTWDEAWEFYKEECIASVCSSTLELIGYDVNDFELFAHLNDSLLELAEYES